MRVAAIIAKTALFLAYPFLLYLGLRGGHVRAVGLGTAAVAIVVLLAFAGERRGAKASELTTGPLVLVALGIASAVFHDRRFVLAMPVLVNGAMFAQFASSLRTTPIVERFARMIDGELSDAQVAYCRTVTKVWCAYFVLNGGVAATLAALDAMEAWTLHTGVVGYVGMGILGATEYVVRKYRFRIFDDHPVDRVLRRLFPTRSST